MRLSFDSIDEVKEFVKGLKGTRSGKAGDADEGPAGQAPAPLQPPAGGPAFNPGGFVPQGPGAGPMGGGFPAAAATMPAPEVVALVARINAKIDSAIASGQPADSALTWFRAQCGPEAAGATLDQIKTVFLYKTALPTLEQIAKLMAA